MVVKRTIYSRRKRKFCFFHCIHQDVSSNLNSGVGGGIRNYMFATTAAAATTDAVARCYCVPLLVKNGHSACIHITQIQT